MNKQIIGGEFVFSEEMLERPIKHSVLDLALKHHPDYHHYLTGGGYFSLKVILSHLKSLGHTRVPVLLPAFLCPSILKPFKELNIPYTFYPITAELKADPETLDAFLHKGKNRVLMIIPYFGFGYDKSLRSFIDKLRFTGVKVIEDRAQCLFPDFAPLGNYVFYSFRKFLPVDGSLLLSDETIDFDYDHDNSHYTAMKKYGQQLRHRFLASGDDTEEEFLKVFSQAEEVYHQRGIAQFEMTNLALFPRLNISRELRERRKHYGFLQQHLAEIALLKNPSVDLGSPLCFPVAVPQRNKLKESLKKQRIYAPVHWHLEGSGVPPGFRDAYRLSKSILSLPLRPGTPKEAYMTMVNIVKQHITAYSS